VQRLPALVARALPHSWPEVPGARLRQLQLPPGHHNPHPSRRTGGRDPRAAAASAGGRAPRRCLLRAGTELRCGGQAASVKRRFQQADAYTGHTGQAPCRPLCSQQSSILGKRLATCKQRCSISDKTSAAALYTAGVGHTGRHVMLHRVELALLGACVESAFRATKLSSPTSMMPCCLSCLGAGTTPRCNLKNLF
jgi:hypothetical protein